MLNSVKKSKKVFLATLMLVLVAGIVPFASLFAESYEVYLEACADESHASYVWLYELYEEINESPYEVIYHQPSYEVIYHQSYEYETVYQPYEYETVYQPSYDMVYKLPYEYEAVHQPSYEAFYEAPTEYIAEMAAEIETFLFPWLTGGTDFHRVTIVGGIRLVTTGFVINSDTDNMQASVGTTFTIWPTSPQGYRFVRWESSLPVFDGALYSNESQARFTVPASAVTVTAVFTPIAPEDYREVTITGGTLTHGSTHVAGTAVTVKAAPPAGYRFVRWESSSPVNFAGTQNSASAWFIMPDTNVAITAIFEAIPVKTTTFAVMNQTVLLRQGPGANYASLWISAHHGSLVKVIDTSVNGDWALINSGWFKGWVPTASFNNFVK